MYKKMLTIILAIAIVATLGTIGVSAASYPIEFIGEQSYPSWAHGGSCYDMGDYLVRANAWASDPNAWNGVELTVDGYGSWLDIGINKGDIADAYSSTFMYQNAYQARELCSYYAWGSYARNIQ